MANKKHTFNLTEIESVSIVNTMNKNMTLTHIDSTEENLDNELIMLFFAREVAIYLSNHASLEENSFYLVRIPFKGKIVDISVGYIKIENEKIPKLTYGSIHR